MNNTAPALRTNRSLLKTILLSIITIGIYGIVVYCHISDDINTIASRYDGKKTMNYFPMLLLTIITFGIVYLVWGHRISVRIGDELRRRNIAYDFGAGNFWGWNIVGTLIIVGPLVYGHQIHKAMNLLCADYNVNG